MPRIISPEVRLEAMRLYVAGESSAKQITEKISDQFGVDITISTVYSWSKKFNWDDERIQLQGNASVAVMECAQSSMPRPSACDAALQLPDGHLPSII